MIVIIDLRSRQSFATETYSEASKIVGVHADTLSRWEKKKLECKQMPFEQFSHYQIYYNTRYLKSEK